MSERDKRLTLVACILASIVVFLDGSVVNVALPSIRDDLNAGLATQQWIVEAYLLTLGALILTGGAYADIRGRKHSLLLGVILFAATSLACAVAPNAEFLVAARALQGVAGAVLVPASLAILTASFDGTERGAAIGSWTAWTGIAFVIGPLAGGTIIEAISWRGVFAINLPIAAVTVWIAARSVPESKDPEAAGKIDLPASILSMIWLGGAVFALIEQSDRGWGDPLVYIPLLAAAVALPAFLWHEAHTEHPMLPLDLFRVRNFSVVNAATLTIYGGLGALTFFLVIYLQQVADYSPLGAGLALLPITIVMFFLSKRFGALSAKVGPRLPMTAGPIIGGAGLFMLRYVDANPDYWTEVLPWLLVFALGLSMTVAPLTVTVLSSVSEHHAGVASGVNNATARIAGLLAIAVVGAVVSSSFSSSLGNKLPPKATEEANTQPLVTQVPSSVPRGQRAEAKASLTSASVDAFRAGVTLSALLVAAGGVISGIGVRNPRPRHAQPRRLRREAEATAEPVPGVSPSRS